jgi:hypothetical protein
MSKVPITVTVPAAFGAWLAGLGHERDRSLSVLVREAWTAKADALSNVEPDGEEKNAMHVAGLYLRGLADIAKLPEGLEGYRELSLLLPEDLADEIDEEVDRLEVPADVIIAWICEKALEPPADVAMFRS